VRVLVTGAAGQVGREIVARLAHHDVLAADHALLDIADRDAVEQVLSGFLPDVVVNAAGNTDVDGCEDDSTRAFLVNGLALRYLAVSSTRIGAHLVHLSTDYVFAGDRPAYHEWDEPEPVSVYGRSKRAGEIEVVSHGASWTIVRSAWIFGAGRNFVDTVVGRARAGEGLRVVDDQRGSPTYSRDLAACVARVATEHRQGLFHVTNQGTATWYELARDALTIAGLDAAAVEPISSKDLDRPAPRPASSVLDNLALRLCGLPLLRHYREALVEHLADGTAQSADQ
jgi:dTDP-4-dehydrorhamnose reductase